MPTPAHLPDREDARPLWSQVKSLLLDLIVRQGLTEHARLPSEAELCARFGVSRTVVREALTQLVHERVIYKLQGKGAFVAGRPEEQDFVGSTIGFSGELADKRRTVTREVLRQTVEPAGSRLAQLLRLSPDTPLVAIDRVLSVDGIPRTIVRWKMPEALVPGLDRAPLQNRSLYDTLARSWGIAFARAERWIEAVPATEEEAALLHVAPGTPLLLIESVAALADGNPVEYWTSLYRTDRSRLHIAIGPR